MISIYAHIPFCLSKCGYCDFYSLPVDNRGKVPHERYCGAMLKQFARDVKRLSLQDRGVTSIYFGGGTPSLMPVGLFEKMLWAIGTTLVMQSDIEITCEVNPATADAAWFKRMVEAGINRFSIGVQSFQDQRLKAIGRLHTGEEAQRAIAEAQDAGALSVNVDLMYGMPGQNLADVESDLKTAMTFQPQHISAYQLTVEKGTPLEEKLKKTKSRAVLPTSDDVLKQLRLARRMLSSGGWEPYEISNFAKPGKRCRHNMHYWSYGEYLGLGCGASSFIVRPAGGDVRSEYGKRWRMTRDADKYLKGRYSEDETDRITVRTAMGEYCFLGLRTEGGVSFEAFERRFGRPLKAAFPKVVQDLEAKGLVEVAEGRLVLTDKGVELSNQVFEQFVE